MKNFQEAAGEKYNEAVEGNEIEKKRLDITVVIRDF